MLLVLLLVSQAQTLPAELSTVNLKITQVDDDVGGSLFVVMSEQFDAQKEAQVRLLQPRVKGLPIKGEHMRAIAEHVARDPQQIFVLTKKKTLVTPRAALLAAGVKVDMFSFR